MGETETVRVTGASRTDAGVHARGQAAHLDLPRPLPGRALVHGVNRHLPADVRILAAGEVDESFHARKSALSKEYSYRLSRAEVISPLEALFAVQVPARIDLSRMDAASALLPGRHDFSAFALAGGSHGQPFRRIFSASWAEHGTLIEVGLGRRAPDELADLLAGRPRSDAGPTAPAHGLTLETVSYPLVVVP
jgi:tRNA pseudouridine38-40 synthase